MPPEVVSILSLIGTLILIILVFAGAFYASKFVGNRYQNFTPDMKSKLEILERRAIGKDQMLLIVRVDNKVILLGATPNHIEKIEELDAINFPEKAKPEDTSISFLGVWKDVLRKKGSEGDTENGNK